jgi:transcriptional regulator with XRE-family HTH domain
MTSVEKSQDMAGAFGAFVKTQRQLAKISQRQLAKASGVSDSYLSQLERGHYSPSVEVLGGIARALDLSPASVLAQFGWPEAEPAPDDGAVDDLELAIERDTSLPPAKREALLVVYRALRDSPEDAG